MTCQRTLLYPSVLNVNTGLLCVVPSADRKQEILAVNLCAVTALYLYLYTHR